MDVTLREAAAEHREELRRLLGDYLFEFDGRTEPYPYFDAYWQEPERVPFHELPEQDFVKPRHWRRAARKPQRVGC